MFSLHNLIYILPAVLIAITLHEYAHGYVSYRLGDPTPTYEGRLSFNPLRHLDVVGTLCLIIFGFGWAKPVQVNPYYYDNRKKGMVMVALAGPFMNFCVAFASILSMGLIIKVTGGYGDGFLIYLYRFLSVLASINIGLGVFNLIPIPPLDGSKVLTAVLPTQQYFKLMQYEGYIQLILFALLWFGFLNTPLYYLRSGVTELMVSVANFVLGLG